jgi:phenylpyruvate tautomerase PptA (4-oxalocrotonate tautomerase family)
MPLLNIQTNQPAPANQGRILRDISAAVADMLGKPERYVMVSLDAGRPMRFAGDDGPLAYLELKSIGLPEERTADFSATLCGLMQDHLDIPPERVYIEFSGAARHLWGWNGGTF